MPRGGSTPPSTPFWRSILRHNMTGEVRTADLRPFVSSTLSRGGSRPHVSTDHQPSSLDKSRASFHFFPLGFVQAPGATRVTKRNPCFLLKEGRVTAPGVAHPGGRLRNERRISRPAPLSTFNIAARKTFSTINVSCRDLPNVSEFCHNTITIIQCLEFNFCASNLVPVL